MRDHGMISIQSYWSRCGNVDRYRNFGGLGLMECPERQTDTIRTSQAVDLSWMNADLVCSWEYHCEEGHSDICERFLGEVFANVRPAWLVDVLEECLVQGSECQPYVALSYVWGQSNPLNTLRSTIDAMRLPHSLSLHNTNISVAKTIRDAMGWVQVLGESYLWVDALCIIQDSSDEKDREISNMAGIFANVTLTLVAAEGPDASYGLRGLRGVSEARALDLRVHALGRAVITELPIHINRFSLAPWSQRGWTCQEDLFSRRQLIFEYNAVRWKCAIDDVGKACKK